MARCASERRAEGEVNSYRNAAGIGRTIFNRGGSFCLPAVAVGSKRTLILPLYQSARLGVTVRWTVTLVRGEPRESGAAPPVAEVASRFQGSVPMAAPRMWAGIGRHDEVSGRSKLAMDKAVGRTIPNRVVTLFNQ